MDKKAKMMVGAVIVVIVIVAAICVVLLNDDDDDDKTYRSSDTTGRLEVFGNANNDDYIDQQDIDFLNQIISRNSDSDTSNDIDWQKNYPFADANNDGKIDQDDVAWVQRMVNRESMDIYMLNGNKEAIKIGYPALKVVVVGSNAMLTVHAIGGVTEGRVVGVTGEKNKDTYLFSDLENITKVSTSVTTANYDAVSQIQGGVDAIITMTSSAYLKNEKTFTDAQYDVIRVSSSDGLEAASVALTLGYIMQLEERSQKFAKFCDDIVSYTEQKAATISDSDKKTVLCGTMTNYVSGLSSDYYELTVLCGGKNLADWNEVTKRYMEGDEWLKEQKYHADWFIHFRNYTYDPTYDLASLYKEYAAYYDDIQTYLDGHYVVMNGYMPSILRMAYIACQLYPDVYGADWADEMHQYYIDNFVDNLHDIGYKVNHSQFVITYNDVYGA